MLKLIQKNPYCILGVCTNGTTRERTARISKIKAYANVGKSVSFPLDFPELIGNIERTTEAVNEVLAVINSVQDCFIYRMFWFNNEDSVDKVALENAISGDIDKAIEILSKRKKFSSLINLAVLHFLRNERGLGVAALLMMIRSPEEFRSYVEDFKKKTDLNCNYSADEVSVMVMSALSNEWGEADLSDVYDKVVTKLEESFGIDLSFEKNEINKNRAKIHIDKLDNIISRYSLDIQDDGIKYNEVINKFDSLYNEAHPVIVNIKNILSLDDPIVLEIGSRFHKILKSYPEKAQNVSSDDITEDKVNQIIGIYNKCKKICFSDIFEEQCQEHIAELEKVKVNIKNNEYAKLFKEMQDEFSNPSNLINYGLPMVKRIIDMTHDLSLGGAVFSSFSNMIVNKIVESVNSAMSWLSRPSVDLDDFKNVVTTLIDGRAQLGAMVQFAKNNGLEYFLNQEFVAYSNKTANDFRDVLQTIANQLNISYFEIRVSGIEECVKRKLHIYDDDWSYSPKDYEGYRAEKIRKRKIEEERRKEEARRKAEEAQKKQTVSAQTQNSERNPNKNEGCYIATLVYGDYNHPQVMLLRKFRDNVLLTNYFGKKFVRIYYRYSPGVVEKLRNHKIINGFIRYVLDVMIYVGKKIGK